MSPELRRCKSLRALGGTNDHSPRRRPQVAGRRSQVATDDNYRPFAHRRPAKMLVSTTFSGPAGHGQPAVRSVGILAEVALSDFIRARGPQEAVGSRAAERGRR